jgi:hypothetical protein
LGQTSTRSGSTLASPSAKEVTEFRVVGVVRDVPPLIPGAAVPRADVLVEPAAAASLHLCRRSHCRSRGERSLPRFGRG